MESLSATIQWVLLIIIGLSTLRLRNKIYLPTKTNELMHSDYGIPLGTTFPVGEFKTMFGERINTYENNKKTIVLITAPSCSVCKGVYPSIEKFKYRHDDNYRFVSLMFGEEKEIEIIKKTYELSIPIVRLEHEDLQSIQTEMFPFGYLLSADGEVISKGLIATEEHLETLRTWSPKKPSRLRNFSINKAREKTG